MHKASEHPGVSRTKMGQRSLSMDQSKGKFTGNSESTVFNGKIFEHLWFPVDFPFNQFIEPEQS